MERYRLDNLEAALRNRLAHVLRPALAPGLSTCQRCRGAKSPSFSECVACANRDLTHRVNQVGIVNYVLEESQLYQYFVAYKNEANPNSNVNFNILSCQLYSALTRHLDCSNIDGHPITWWTNIPSTRRSRKSHEHPIYEIASAPIDAHHAIPYLPIEATGVTNSRQMVSDRFAISDPNARLDGAHILIVDDLWVSGGSVDSLALNLRERGAARVSAMCLGRQVACRWEPGRYLAEMLELPGTTYHPEICPWNPEKGCSIAPHRSSALQAVIEPKLRPLVRNL